MLRAAWQGERRASGKLAWIVLLVILGPGVGTAWAGTNVWTGLGPEGGAIQALAIDPQNPKTIYAASSGVFKSKDGGASWKPANSGLPTNGIAALAINPQNPSTVYAVANGGIFKSTDGAASWNAVSSGLPVVTGPVSGVPPALAIDPQNPSTLALRFWSWRIRLADVLASNNWYRRVSSPTTQSNFVIDAARVIGGMG